MKGVFACNQLDLSEIEVYGFDYDYTLACYKPAMGYILYNLGRDMLVNKYKVSKVENTQPVDHHAEGTNVEASF